MYLNLILIALMVVYVYDLTDFSQSMLKVLWRYTYATRPFPDGLSWSDIHPLLKICECSTCAVWWTTLIYTLLNSPTLPNIAICMGMSYLTPVIYDMLVFVRGFISAQINKLINYFNI